jgi:surfactin synthase thioesterase subunit
MIGSTMTSYLDRQPAPGDGLRLFCFHHAGGGASAYSGWRKALGPEISVFPVQLPGREGRVTEPAFTDIDSLVADLDEQLDPFLAEPLPFAFYGHSMGALVAYNLVRRRSALGRSLPGTLLVGAYPGPHHNAPLAAVRDLGDEELFELMAGIGGLPDIVRRFKKWASLQIALFRHDLAVCDSYDPAHAEPLTVPIQVFTGADDPLMSTEDAASWSQHTTAACEVHVLPGGHFFTKDSREVFLPLLATSLTR